MCVNTLTHGKRDTQTSIYAQPHTHTYEILAKSRHKNEMKTAENKLVVWLRVSTSEEDRETSIQFIELLLLFIAFIYLAIAASA